MKINQMCKRDLCKRDFKIRKERFKLGINLMFKILKKDSMRESNNQKML